MLGLVNDKTSQYVSQRPQNLLHPIKGIIPRFNVGSLAHRIFPPAHEVQKPNVLDTSFLYSAKLSYLDLLSVRIIMGIDLFPCPPLEYGSQNRQSSQTAKDHGDNEKDLGQRRKKGR